MNERIVLLKHQASVWCDENIPDQYSEETNGYGSAWEDKFAELIVEECRTVVNDLYHKTPLELCGPLLTADEKIAEHFYGVEE